MRPASSPHASLSVLVGILLLCAHAAIYHAYISDDSFIALRYARRLVDGLGLTWTDGEKVEGYSSLLFVLLCAGLAKLGVELVLAARIVSALGGLLTFVGLARATRSRSLAATGIGTLVLSSSGALAVWCAGGLESSLLAGFVALGFAELGDWLDTPARAPRLRASLWFGLAALTRPDAAIMCVAAAGVLLAVAPLRLRARLSELTRFCVLAAVPALLQLAFRVAYYHRLVPNTALKLGLSRHHVLDGAAYVGAFALGELPLLLLLALAWWPGVRIDRRRCVLFALPALVWGAYVVSVGGDFMPGHRLLVPVVPLLALLAATVTHGLSEHRRRVVLLMGAYALAIATVLVQRVQPDNLAAGSETWSWQALRLGQLLRHSYEPERPLVAVDAAGAIAYGSRLPVLDLLGLSDETIAHTPLRYATHGIVGHERGNGAYALARAPDLIVFNGPRGGPPRYASGLEMQATPRFADDYLAVTLTVDDWQSHAYVRRRGKLGIQAGPASTRVPALMLAALTGRPVLLSDDVATVTLPAGTRFELDVGGGALRATDAAFVVERSTSDRVRITVHSAAVISELRLEPW